MADSRHVENLYVAVFQSKMMRFCNILIKFFVLKRSATLTKNLRDQN